MAVVVGRPIEGITLNGLEYLLDAEGFTKKFDSQDDAEAFLKAEGFETMDGFVFQDEKEMQTHDIKTDKSPEPKKLEPTDQNIIDTFIKVTERNPKIGDSAKAMLVADKCNTTKSYVYSVLNEWTAKEN